MEIPEFRRRLDNFVRDVDVMRLDDESWYDRIWRELLDPVLDARVERQYRDDGTHKLLPSVEAHRFSFEGSTTKLASHLVHSHGLAPSNVVRWANGLSQGDWIALDDMHSSEHKIDQRKGRST
jgi:hypothetical protein